MNQQPEALRIANEYRPTMGLDVVRLWAPDAVAELRRQHAEIESFHNLAEGCTPADAYILREANHALAIENEALRKIPADARILREVNRVLAIENEALRSDAERYRFLDHDFSPMGLNIDGNHAWAYRRNATLKGPTLSEAIDAAMEAKP